MADGPPGRLTGYDWLLCPSWADVHFLLYLVGFLFIFMWSLFCEIPGYGETVSLSSKPNVMDDLIG